MKAMDDKKKLIMLGALAAVMLAVGAFQFIGKGNPEQSNATAAATQAAPSPATNGGAQPSAADEKKAGEKNTLVAGSFSQRDPFKPILMPDGGRGPVVHTPTPAATYRPPTMTGSLAPISISPTGLPGVQSGQLAEPEKPAFAYRLSGVIVGARPAAVFMDEQGTQRLITQGGSLDPDTKLIDVDRNAVRLRFKDKTLTLTLGGDSSEQ